MSTNIEYILSKFPDTIKKSFYSLPDYVVASLEEVRVKVEGPISVYALGKEYFLSRQNRFSEQANEMRKITREELMHIFNAVLNYSAYAYEDELVNGYVTIQGGHRVGICGKTVLDNGHIKTLKDISSINIRRSREIIGISEKYIQYILKDSKSIHNTLIVSPPKCGKTTLLRDIIRNLSQRGFKIGLVDERSEIAGMYEGVPQNNIGFRTDILDGCPKEKGIIMMIRSMSPDIIATDEIGKNQDVYAVECAINAGIHLITTIHGSSYEDIKTANIKKLIEEQVFNRIIILSNMPTTGSVKKIINSKGESIL